MERDRLVRLGLLGTLMLIAIAAAPLGLRWCYGTVPLGFLVTTVVMHGVVGAVSIGFMLWLFERSSRRGVPTRRAAKLALGLTVPVMAIWYLVQLAITRALPGLLVVDPSEPQSVEFALASSLADSVPALALFAGLVFFPAVLHAEELRRREVEVLRREADILRLRSHLEPHFVVNTLNAISGFVTESPAEARALINALGELFGEASRFEPRHPVADELRWLERYLEIHLIRFGPALSVRWDIAPEARARTCPALILQPLVENALKHGALRRPAGSISVRAAVASDALVLEVRDDGPRLGPRRPGGRGLSLLERRLELEGRAGARLELRRVGDETVATVLLPHAEVES